MVRFEPSDFQFENSGFLSLEMHLALCFDKQLEFWLEFLY